MIEMIEREGYELQNDRDDRERGRYVLQNDREKVRAEQMQRETGIYGCDASLPRRERRELKRRETIGRTEQEEI